MITSSEIKKVYEFQAETFAVAEKGLLREAITDLPALSKHALIITGIRRCGKSTLLRQFLTEKYPGAFSLNFADNRLYGFDNYDFTRLDEIIRDTRKKALFFDEIQEVEGWDRYVRQKLDEGFKVCITGSNASLLSKELGTKLTGRHISKELFPFSFTEYLRYTGSKANPESLLLYLKCGGFPEYLNMLKGEILTELFDDILIRDIVVRYGIRDIKGLQRLALYLISNTGNKVTAGKLKQTTGISATSTVMEYFSHLELAYLFYFIPKFSWSVRSQLVNPRKIYSADTGLITFNSGSFTEDTGRKLENAVHSFLRSRYRNIFYWHGKTECDFVVMTAEKKPLLLQVCSDLGRDNLERELEGISEAATFFSNVKGIIVTLNQSDTFTYKKVRVNAVPAWRFMSGNLRYDK
ncbi:MAG: ATP-binding protein [Bacteroidales bacterium]